MRASRAPGPVTSLSSGVLAIAAGGHHACAMMSVAVSNQNTNLFAAVIAAGERHTCAVTTNGIDLTGAGVVWCWGDNTSGQLGNTSVTQSLVPIVVSSLSSLASTLALGDDFTCALTDDEAVECWGDNAYGQLGNGAESGADGQ
jgi:alpha-tubulin suppressor-like RCC1 family protein